MTQIRLIYTALCGIEKIRDDSYFPRPFYFPLPCNKTSAV